MTTEIWVTFGTVALVVGLFSLQYVDFLANWDHGVMLYKEV